MTAARRDRRVPPVAPREPEPLRTCLGCRRARPQGGLLRLRRTPDGVVEPDPDRRGGGRGAWLCRSAACLAEALRRGRWSQAFRAPAVLGPDALARLRTLLAAESTGVVEGRVGSGTGGRAGDPGEDVKGGS